MYSRNICLAVVLSWMHTVGSCYVPIDLIVLETDLETLSPDSPLSAFHLCAAPSLSPAPACSLHPSPPPSPIWILNTEVYTAICPVAVLPCCDVILAQVGLWSLLIVITKSSHADGY